MTEPSPEEMQALETIIGVAREVATEHYVASRAMQEHGGSFVQQLGKLLERADVSNAVKIKTTWPKIYFQYYGMGLRLGYGEVEDE